MSGISVLEFVARELEGRILTVSSLSAFVAAENAADRLGMTAISRNAAELAVLLPKASMERIREEFGRETAEIVEVLRAKSWYSRIAFEAMSLHGSSCGNRNCGDAAIAACAAEAAVVSPEDSGRMAEWLESMANRETDTERSAFLRELRDRLPSPGQADRERKTRGQAKVISVSMDVCASTELKARMRACTRDENELAKWYEEFHRQFLLLELRFYSGLFKANANDSGLDWKNAFVVKGIGDEIWLLYEVGEDELWKLGSLIARLMDEALNVAGRAIRWTSAPEDHEGSRVGSWETECLPLKFYVDMLDDAFEVSGPRRDLVTERLSDILGTEESWQSEDFMELGNRLHAGNLMADGRRLLTTIRTDYIGWEVDRFFRATKSALPGVVTVGRTLFEETFGVRGHTDENVGGTGLMKTVLRCPIQQGGSAHFRHCFRYVKKNIAAEDLKGLGEGYTVYRVLRDLDLLKLYHTGADQVIMEETFKVFTEAMVRAERDQRQK